MKRTTAWELRRLEAKAPDLHRRVVAGRLSLHRALVSCGLREPHTTVRLNPQAIAEVALRSLRAQEVEDLIGLLRDGLGPRGSHDRHPTS